MNHSRSISDILIRAAQAKVAEITEQVILYTGRVVQAGPFKGMKLPETASWGNGDVLPKILGTYEQELNVSIETCIARKPEVVVNIGCAEGYYAVGIAQRLASIGDHYVMIYAYDSDPKALPACEEAARLNTTNKVQIGGIGPIKIDMLDLRDKKSLYVIDCEGAELSYVEDPAHFKNADLIIECHDCAERPVIQPLTERLSATHDITIVRESPRDPSSIELLRNLNTLERYASVCEFRPGPVMRWLVATAKSRS